MFSTFPRRNLFTKIFCALLSFTFFLSSFSPTLVSAQTQPQWLINQLPTNFSSSVNFVPAHIMGVNIHPDNPLRFDFIIEKGDAQFDDASYRDEAQKLIKYFLAALATPENEMWVNLSPYEKDRIIPSGFGKTEMGRDLLALDYILKQLTASLMSPQDELGEKFWKKMRAEAKAKFGTDDLGLNTFNKIWIIPETASIYEHEKGAVIIDSKLKVMLETDYLATQKDLGDKGQGVANLIANTTKETPQTALANQAMREIVIPAIEDEVNTGKTFANLRQIYSAVILANWYKDALKKSLLGQVYVDQEKTQGITTDNQDYVEEIYNQYVKMFKEGVYDYIKEEYDPDTQQVIPRKYFSGGVRLQTQRTDAPLGDVSGFIQKPHEAEMFAVALADPNRPNRNNAMLTPSAEIKQELDAKAQKAILHVVSQTAVKLTALNLRGAYQHVLDILNNTGTDNGLKRLQLQKLFEELYSRTQKEEIEQVVQLIVATAEDHVITSDELKKISTAIKDTADAFAKRIFEQTVKREGMIMMVRASEGFGRDAVAESLKSNEVIVPEEISGDIAYIITALNNNQQYYHATNGKWYIILDSVLDVIEGTNQFVVNSRNIPVTELGGGEVGATSFNVSGLGIRSLGNTHDGYVAQFITNLGSAQTVAEFKQRRVTVQESGKSIEYHLQDPELYSRHPERILDYLQFLAEVRGQQLSELQEEIVLMDRSRETEFIAAIENVKAKHNITGLTIITSRKYKEDGSFVDRKGVQDGTFPLGAKAVLDAQTFKNAFGKDYGIHQTMITIGGSAEGFAALALAGAAQSIGAVGGLRIYSANLNKNPEGTVMENHSQRYNFRQAEIGEITELRANDAEAILKGDKLFTEEDVKGEVTGMFSLISNDGVFGIEGTEQVGSKYKSSTIIISNAKGEFTAKLVTEVVDVDDAMLQPVIVRPATFQQYVDQVTPQLNALPQGTDYKKRSKLLLDLDNAPQSIINNLLIAINMADTLEEARKAVQNNKSFNTIQKDFFLQHVAIDKAQLGGIDMNSELINVNIERNGVGVQIPVSELTPENFQINGLVPIIINVAPVTNLPLLLGMADKSQERKTSFNKELDAFDRHEELVRSQIN